jgi:cytidylate kinase
LTKIKHIAVVGPCAAGKSALSEALSSLGYKARQIVQEHSYVPQMWQVMTNPDCLIYLDASYEICSERKKLNWSQAEYDEQIRRLAHARENTDIYIQTDDMDLADVLAKALEAIKELQGSAT